MTFLGSHVLAEYMVRLSTLKVGKLVSRKERVGEVMMATLARDRGMRSPTCMHLLQYYGVQH